LTSIPYRSVVLIVMALVGFGVSAARSPRLSGGAVTAEHQRPEPGHQEERPKLLAEEVPRGREFYFTRAVYSGLRRRYFESWSVDYPKADRQFLIGLRRLTNIEAYEMENPVRLDDPDLRRYPFLYILEVGYMSLTEAEVIGLREFLLAGGFLLIDDFWGTWEWMNFESEMQRVLPGYRIVDIPLDHPLLSVFYEIDELVQVPNVGQGVSGGPTWERDGYVPALRGVFDEKGRLMVAINWNTDLGDAWEWAENPFYPLKYSNFAYQMGINSIVYAMSH
jgi:Domain of unknown function (DUF4159)